MRDAEELHRSDDHATSIKAARKVVKKISKTMRAVHGVLANHPDGLIDSELTECMHALGYRRGGESTYRRRRTDLFQLGYVAATGARRLNGCHNEEQVWVITDKPLPEIA